MYCWLALGCRGLGMGGNGGRRVASFAYGPQRSWLRFTVFFMCSDGAIFALCPVAPFGAGVPQSAVQSLAESAAHMGSAEAFDTTETWLQQVSRQPVSVGDHCTSDGIFSFRGAQRQDILIRGMLFAHRSVCGEYHTVEVTAVVQALPGSCARSGVLMVQRHALDEHAPGLVGPMSVTSGEGPLDSFLDCGRHEGDAAVNLCTLRYCVREWAL
jgi:hypothetical protein